MLHLFEDKELCPSTIYGYRAAISNVYSNIGGPNVGTDSSLSSLLKSFEIERPKPKRLFPQWNLALVLDSLMRLPYEPLSACDIKHLTFKCALLLALASGRRRSEIHAFSMSTDCLRFSQNYSSVILKTDPAFIAKNQIRNFSPEPVKIPALSSVVGHADRDRLLCPVRTLRFYLDKTKGGGGAGIGLVLSCPSRQDVRIYFSRVSIKMDCQGY